MIKDLYIKDKNDAKILGYFFKNYELEVQIECPERRNKPTIPKSNRICRFCGNVGGDKWKKKAHLIPHLLGNNTLFSFDECDDCNSHFSEKEADFAAFLGVSRTINKVKGKKGIPQFNSSDKTLSVTNDNDWYNQNSIRIERKSIEDETIKIDFEKGVCQITTSKESYIPRDAFKILLKIAYASLPIKELKNYSIANQLLMRNLEDPGILSFCAINKDTLPFGYTLKSPVLQLFKKKNSELPHPTHVVLFFWQNYRFQYCIPIHENDMKLFSGKSLTTPSLPVFFLEPVNNITIVNEIADLSSGVTRKHEKEIISFEFNPNTEFFTFDPSNHKIINELPHESTIKGVRIVNSNFVIPIKD